MKSIPKITHIFKSNALSLQAYINFLNIDHFTISKEISYFPEKVILESDWKNDDYLISYSDNVDAIFISGYSLLEIELFFRVTAKQILNNNDMIDKPSIVFLPPESENASSAPRILNRIKKAWPFKSLLFITNNEMHYKELQEQGFPIFYCNNENITLSELLTHDETIQLIYRNKRKIAVQIQTMWGRCGSSTAFANQIDALIDADYFVVRIFLGHDYTYGMTVKRFIDHIYPGNAIDTRAHLEVMACPTNFGADIQPQTADEYFIWTLRRRLSARLFDATSEKIISAADLVIVNHAINMGFVYHYCQKARIILDTHDHLTRNEFERAKIAKNTFSFPNKAVLRRYAQLESELWRTADICTTVSASEKKRIQRYAKNTLLVYPKPYEKLVNELPKNPEWDLFITADRHVFNIQSVNWFLESVVAQNPIISKMRIAITGNINSALESLWCARLPNVKWLGFVQDLTQIRNQSRLTICPDQAGTGISVKAITAICTGHPFLATRIALRDFPEDVIEMISPTDDAKMMQHKIIALVENEELLADLKEKTINAFNMMQGGNSYSTAISIVNQIKTTNRNNRLFDFLGMDTPKTIIASMEGQSIHASFSLGGKAELLLGKGWHHPENWGRWIDGNHATLHLPKQWLTSGAKGEIVFISRIESPIVHLYAENQKLYAHIGKISALPTQKNTSPLYLFSLVFEIQTPEIYNNNNQDNIELRIESPEAFFQSKQGDKDFVPTVLGIGICSMTVARGFSITGIKEKNKMIQNQLN